MRVSLITTGVMEFKGLPGALLRIFPDHEFRAEPFTPGRPFHGFTANRVLPLNRMDPPGKASLLLRAALGTLISDDGVSPVSDLAIVLDDLELCNLGNDGIVIEHVRESARKVVETNRSVEPEKIRQFLRERVSFHLAKPMAESWFFGDLGALQVEVPAASWPPQLESGRDPEDFQVVDPAYLVDDGANCSALIAKIASGAKRKRPDWAVAQRDQHPKHYLEWLMRDPSAADCTRYKEAKEGVRLLRTIDWRVVLGTGSWFPFLRALVRDLESTLGPSPCGIPAGGVEAPLASRLQLPEDPVLRNL